ncbi:MAG: carboxymuconolactone decarboxylase family protein [Deferribacterales bacterium]
MQSQIERREEIFTLAKQMRAKFPEFEKNMTANDALVYGDGALPESVKRMMAMVGALVSRCEGCILSQTMRAIDSGATAAEIIEACHVAMMLGGTMALAESTKVLALLKEKGMID